MSKVLAAVLALVASSVFAQETIKIGVITDKVGPAKPYSEPTLEGIVFGANEINAKGGVLGRRLELLIEDDQGRPDISATMARKLVDAGAVFILSITLTPATQQQQNVTLEAKTPQMTPMNSGDTLTTQLPNPYFWQTGPLGSVQIATLLSHARAKQLKKVALISDNSDLGQLLAKFFRRAADAEDPRREPRCDIHGGRAHAGERADPAGVPADGPQVPDPFLVQPLGAAVHVGREGIAERHHLCRRL
jgi:branched-chain amino acid transport system substrate-binding protein